MNKKIIIVIFSIIFCKITFAQEKLSFSLQEAQSYAVQHNYEMKNAALDIDIAKQKIKETTAIGLPQINGELSYNNNIEAAKMPFPVAIIPKDFWPFLGIPNDTPLDGTYPISFSQKHTSNAIATANQLVFSGPYLIGLQAAKTYKKLSEQNLQKTERDIKANIAEGYYLVLLSESTIETVKQNFDNINKILYETEKLFQEGFTEETNVDQLQITVNTLKNQINLLERSIDLAHKMLKYQMGLNINENVVLTDNINYFLEETKSINYLLSDFNYKTNIDYDLFTTQVKLNELSLKKEKFEYLPSLSAFYNFQFTAFRDDFTIYGNKGDWLKSQLFGFSLNIPIFSSGSRGAIVKQKKLELIKSKNSLLQFEQGLKVQYEDAKSNFLTAYQNYLIEKDNLALSKKIYDKTVIKHREGLANSLELTQTNDQYLNVQASYTNSIIDMLNAKVILEKIYN